MLQRYLGTVREEDTLNILLEFVPGGSISSLLGKFGAFPEAVSFSYRAGILFLINFFICKSIPLIHSTGNKNLHEAATNWT